jgi:hypothetical protein
VLLAAACSSGGSRATVTTQPGAAPSTTQVSSTSIFVTASTRVTLKCRDQLGWDTPASGYSVVLNKVALPTKKAFGASHVRPHAPKSKYFAKQGLYVKAGATFELIVPAAWKSRVTIGWGNPGKDTTHLYVTGCTPIKKGAHWLVFAGGFTMNKPACIPIVVKSGAQQKTVHVGAGKACPGQAPPPK